MLDCGNSYDVANLIRVPHGGRWSCDGLRKDAGVPRLRDEEVDHVRGVEHLELRAPGPLPDFRRQSSHRHPRLFHHLLELEGQQRRPVCIEALDLGPRRILAGVLPSDGRGRDLEAVVGVEEDQVPCQRRTRAAGHPSGRAQRGHRAPSRRRNGLGAASTRARSWPRQERRHPRALQPGSRRGPGRTAATWRAAPGSRAADRVSRRLPESATKRPAGSGHRTPAEPGEDRTCGSRGCPRSTDPSWLLPSVSHAPAVRRTALVS